MKKKRRDIRVVLWLAFFTGILFICYPGSTCAEQEAIIYKVPPSAEITKVTYYIGKVRDFENVFFEIGIKNISNQPKRFRVIVDIPDGPSAAYLYPTTGKPPVLKAGEEHMKPFPLLIYKKLPSAFSITVEEQ